jgi:hypothetical protein
MPILPQPELNIHEIQTMAVYAAKLVHEGDQKAPQRRQELAYRTDNATAQQFLDACEQILRLAQKIEGVDLAGEQAPQ